MATFWLFVALRSNCNMNVQCVHFMGTRSMTSVQYIITPGTVCYTPKSTTSVVTDNDMDMLMEMCTGSIGHLSRHDMHFQECFTQPHRYLLACSDNVVPMLNQPNECSVGHLSERDRQPYECLCGRPRTPHVVKLHVHANK
jgi:hypothetical protein